jgi:uncharacterized protein (TIGR03083 family)
MSEARIIQNLATVWDNIDRLCTPLSEEQWQLSTDCPDWTVKDLVAHMTGSECVLLGQPAPEHVPARAGTLPNVLAERNEVHVDYRRSQPSHVVLKEFREVTRTGCGRCAPQRGGVLPTVMDAHRYRYLSRFHADAYLRLLRA